MHKVRKKVMGNWLFRKVYLNDIKPLIYTFDYYPYANLYHLLAFLLIGDIFKIKCCCCYHLTLI